MRWLRSLRFIFAGWFTRSRSTMEREIDDELLSHLEHRTDALMRSGLMREEAAHRARVEFGAVEACKDRLRDERGWRLGDELRQDARYAWRMLRRHRAFAFVAIATLAIGIGANAAIFTIVDGVLLRPLPYPDPDRVVMLYESSSDYAQGYGTVSYPNFLDWHDSARSFEHMVAFIALDASLTLDADVEHVRVVWASADLLSVLGTPPAFGRAISPDEDKQQGPKTALISYALWQSHFGGRPDVIGRPLKIDADTFSIVGVLPIGFSLRRGDVWVSITHHPNPVRFQREIRGGTRVMARLKPGVTPAQSAAEMVAIEQALAERYPAANKGYITRQLPLFEDVVGDVRPTLFLMLGAVGLVLLIVCANVANLLLSRAEGRRREFAVRAALGAGIPRLIRQLVLESVLLSLIGGALGLLVASLGTAALLRQLPVTIPRADTIGVDVRVIVFTFLASLVTGVLFGLAPAFHSARVDVQDALKATSRSVMGGHSRMRNLFVIVQLTLGLVLMVSTGLLLRTLWRLSQVDPGFDIHHVTTMRVGLPSLAEQPPAKIRQWFQDTEERMSHMPGVEGAAFADMLPLMGDDELVQYWIGPTPTDPSRTPSALLYLATPGYFHTMKIPLRAGRTFTWADAKRSPTPVVVDDAFARRVFGTQNPIGQTFTLQLQGPAEIIGVVGHVKHWGLDVDDSATVREEVYVPFSHLSDRLMPLFATVGESLVLRSNVEPAQLQQAVRADLRAGSGNLAIYALRTMEDMAAERSARRRFLAIVLAYFAAIAMGLAGIGVYGVMAYSVSQRVQEIGIRMALGASARQVFDQIVRQGFRVVLVGIVTGLSAAVLATRLLASMLYGVTATDPLTFASVAALLVAVALAACAIPAFRAVRIDPTAALRQD